MIDYSGEMKMALAALSGGNCLLVIGVKDNKNLEYHWNNYVYS